MSGLTPEDLERLLKNLEGVHVSREDIDPRTDRPSSSTSAANGIIQFIPWPIERETEEEMNKGDERKFPK